MGLHNSRGRNWRLAIATTNQLDVWLLLHWAGCVVGSPRGQIAGFVAEVRALPTSVGGHWLD